ncbi:helix-turn-helix domain-containing protein [Salinactinospora qingdaonensis]|uniref:Helix-turn-helix transcriptional regulator n=1 Tax=Salinactinospora qingdaonensis TaxID=702744 RepID=A0ABP7FGW3_9ACTN
MSPDKRALIRYGREISRLRRDDDLTQTALGKRVGVGKSHISDIERGKTTPSASLRAELDKAIGHGRLERLWDDLTGSGREAWKYEVAELIHGASAVYEYEVLVVPAYLQTAEYARTLIRYAVPWLSEDEVETRVEERAKRAEQFANAPQPMLWLVLDETILFRRYGSPEIMREQLAYLVDLAERERIAVHIVPADTPKHPGISGAFKLITTDHVPDVLIAESIREGQVVTNTVEVSQYRMLFTALQGVALPPGETVNRIREEIARLEQ